MQILLQIGAPKDEKEKMAATNGQKSEEERMRRHLPLAKAIIKREFI